MLRFLLSTFYFLLCFAWCVGADPCTACRDCSRCAYCNGTATTPPQGSCGVLRNLTPEQSRKRLKKIEGRKP